MQARNRYRWTYAPYNYIIPRTMHTLSRLILGRQSKNNYKGTYTMKFSILGLIAATLLVSTVASADPSGGSKRVSDTLGRDIQVTYDVVLNGDEVTVFMINGDGRSDIDCVLYDEGGQVVQSDTDSTSSCIFAQTPRWTGHFSLVVKNVGGRVTSFFGTIT